MGPACDSVKYSNVSYCHDNLSQSQTTLMNFWKMMLFHTVSMNFTKSLKNISERYWFRSILWRYRVVKISKCQSHPVYLLIGAAYCSRQARLFRHLTLLIFGFRFISPNCDNNCVYVEWVNINYPKIHEWYSIWHNRNGSLYFKLGIYINITSMHRKY